MKKTSKVKWRTALSRYLCAAVLLIGMAGLLVAYPNAAEADTLNGTAYSRTMGGEIMNWNNNGCSYSLDGDGNVILAYDHGGKTAKVPLTLFPDNSDKSPNTGNTGFFISSKKTALSYSSPNYTGPITIMVSGDMGQTWESTKIDFEGAATWMHIGFTNMNDGWLVVCNFVGMGAEKHYIYKTADGGRTWVPTESDIDDVYGRMLSGAGFANDKVGFLCFRYENLDFEPAVCMTRDGGRTWSKLHIDIPEEYSGYNKTALSPLFDGTNVIVPFRLSDDNGQTKTVYLTSSDYGETWKCANDQSGLDKDAAYQSKQEFLDSSDGHAFQIAAYKFAKAFFNKDTDILKSYLTDPDNTLKEYPFDYGFNDVEFMILKLSPGAIRKDSVTAEYEFKLNSEDSYTYLYLDMIKMKDQWKIESYGLEK